MDSDWNQLRFGEGEMELRLNIFCPLKDFCDFSLGLAVEDGPLICFARPSPMADTKKLNGFFILTLHDSLVFIVFANGAPYIWWLPLMPGSKSWTWCDARSSRCLFPISSNSNPHFRSSSVRSPPISEHVACWPLPASTRLSSLLLSIVSIIVILLAMCTPGIRNGHWKW